MSHTTHWQWLAIPALAAAVAMTAHAQTPDADVLAALRDTNALAAPDAKADTVFKVPSGAELVWIGKSERSGFFRVIRRNVGPQGWIAAADVHSVHAAEHHDVGVCAESLQQCPINGCAEPGSAEARDNRIKRTPPKGDDAVTLGFDDLMALQQQADQHVGQGPDDLSKPQREALSGLKVAKGTVTEGDRVRLVGYVAKDGNGLHVNDSGESVNCMLKKPSDNDIHIALVADLSDKEFHAIVAEMIPQDRPPAWNIDALKDVQAQGRHVWVEGTLSYDKVHFVNDDPDNPIKDEPKRRSLWEIHPITKFLVCRQDHCDAQTESDWTALDKPADQGG